MLFVGGPEKADDFIVLLICVSCIKGPKGRPRNSSQWGRVFRKLNFPRNVILYFISCKNSWRSQY